jgi:hypothetical protein
MSFSSNKQGAVKRRSRRRTKAQALVEFALMGIMLGMLLAAAVDLGRAYYTSIVVENMAGEGAAYAANHPDKDISYPTALTCSRYTIATTDNNTIQNRARHVALDRGLVIHTPTQAQITILDSTGAASACTTRCVGTMITVKVTYQMTDLFLPGLLGMTSITISKSASQSLMTSAFAAQVATCP